MELSEHLFRRESGRLVAALTRIFGVHNLALAEDVVQDAFCHALEVWPFRGMPDWAQWIGTIIPVTHVLRVVRGAMLKGVGVAEAAPSLLALLLFVVIVASVAVKKYRTTLD